MTNLYFVGQAARLATEVRDVAGVLTDATVSLTVSAPDGTASSPTVIQDSTGVYHADVDLTQPGQWAYVWTATGAVKTAQPSSIYAYPTDTDWLLSLDEAKAHLGIKTTTDDEELQFFVAAASEFVQSITGAVARQTKSQVVRPSCDGFVWLAHPVLDITAISQPYGGSQTFVPATVLAQSPEREQGKLWLGTGYYHTGYPLRIDYVAGRATIPALIRSAALDYLKWDWLSQRGAAPTPFTTADEFATTQPASVPYKVRAKLEAYSLPGIA